MRHSWEKAMDIAAQLMAAQIQGHPYGTVINQAEEMGKYYLKLVETIHAGIEDKED